jgi:hypothetical protein
MSEDTIEVQESLNPVRSVLAPEPRINAVSYNFNVMRSPVGFNLPVRSRSQEAWRHDRYQFSSEYYLKTVRQQSKTILPALQGVARRYSYCTSLKDAPRPKCERRRGATPSKPLIAFGRPRCHEPVALQFSIMMHRGGAFPVCI